jgi:anti-sigma28 factor (negative regulator of flagellin synthesis)
MSIRSIGTSYGPQRPAAPAPAAPAAQSPSSRATPAQGVAAVRRDTRDTVAISDDARAMAARGPEAGAAQGARAPMSTERVEELRKKVLEGAYNQAHVVDQVARRLLSAGDV